MVKPRRYWPSGIAKRCSCCAAIGNIYTRLDTTGNGYGSFSRPFPNPQPKPTQPRNNPKAGSLRNHGLAPGLDELIQEKGDRFIFTIIISATAHAKPLKANNSLNQSPLPRASRSLLTVSALEPLCSEN